MGINPDALQQMNGLANFYIVIVTLTIENYSTMNLKWTPDMWASQVALAVRKLPTNAANMGSIPESGRSLGDERGSPLEHSQGTRWATVHEVAKSRTRLKWLSSSSIDTHNNLELEWISRELCLKKPIPQNCIPHDFTYTIFLKFQNLGGKKTD